MSKRTKLSDLYTRLAILNQMAKDQDREFMEYGEFYTVQFMFEQSQKVKKRLTELMNQIEQLTPIGRTVKIKRK